MDPATIGAIGAGMSGAGGLVGSVLDYYQGNRQYEYQKEVDEKNYELQQDQYNLEKENLEYQKGLQNTIFEREDTSVQRRVADLKAAGMSPILAAGQGASAGAVVKTDTPQAPQKEYHPNEARLLPIMLQLLEINRMKADITKTNAENELLDYQKMLYTAQTKNQLNQAWRAAEDAKTNAHDRKIAEETDTTSNPSAFPKIIRDLMYMYKPEDFRGKPKPKDPQGYKKAPGNKPIPKQTVPIEDKLPSTMYDSQFRNQYYLK